MNRTACGPKGVLETIRKSKGKMLEKVLGILESKDQSKVNKIERQDKRFDLVIHPWYRGDSRKYSGVILYCSHLELMDSKGVHQQ